MGRRISAGGRPRLILAMSQDGGILFGDTILYLHISEDPAERYGNDMNSGGGGGAGGQ